MGLGKRTLRICLCLCGLQVLAADALRSFVVTVRSSGSGNGSNSAVTMSGDIGFSSTRVQMGGRGSGGSRVLIGGRGGRFGVSSEQSQTINTHSVMQQVRVAEGGQAAIQADGRSLIVSPRMQGDQVIISVQEASREGNRVGGLSTTVSGRPGQWIPLGGIDGSEDEGNSSIGSRSRRKSVTRSGTAIRVDLAR
jgi:hypothetical protein